MAPRSCLCKVSSRQQRGGFPVIYRKWKSPTRTTTTLVSAGLGKERRWYLYKNIRQYVLEPWQDVMCPLPKEQGPNSADEEMPQRPLVGMDTNLPVIVSTKALQSTGYTD